MQKIQTHTLPTLTLLLTLIEVSLEVVSGNIAPGLLGLVGVPASGGVDRVNLISKRSQLVLQTIPQLEHASMLRMTSDVGLNLINFRRSLRYSSEGYGC
jgi:hypothetical protein